MIDKNDHLRTQMKIVQAGIPGNERRKATKRLADIGAPFLISGGRSVIAGYFPVGDEITPLLLMQALFHHQIPLALPKLDDNNETRFLRWWPGERMATGKRGIPEPAESTDEVEPEYLLVPVLGFDATGNRLGFGNGYYSRMISVVRSQKPIVVVGIGFSEQELGMPLDDDEDGRLDWIITPKEVRCLTH